jgi:hypothetical protein
MWRLCYTKGLKILKGNHKAKREKYKQTNNDSKTTAQKTKDLTTRTLQKPSIN